MRNGRLPGDERGGKAGTPPIWGKRDSPNKKTMDKKSGKTSFLTEGVMVLGRMASCWTTLNMWPDHLFPLCFEGFLTRSKSKRVSWGWEFLADRWGLLYAPLCGIISENAEEKWEQGIKMIDEVNKNPTGCALSKRKKLSEKNWWYVSKPKPGLKMTPLFERGIKGSGKKEQNCKLSSTTELFAQWAIGIGTSTISVDCCCRGVKKLENWLSNPGAGGRGFRIPMCLLFCSPQKNRNSRGEQNGKGVGKSVNKNANFLRNGAGRAKLQPQRNYWEWAQLLNEQSRDCVLDAMCCNTKTYTGLRSKQSLSEEIDRSFICTENIPHCQSDRSKKNLGHYEASLHWDGMPPLGIVCLATCFRGRLLLGMDVGVLPSMLRVPTLTGSWGGQFSIAWRVGDWMKFKK